MDLLRPYLQTRAAAAAENVLARIRELPHHRHRLVLVVGGRGTGKSLCIQELAKRTGRVPLNLGVELSSRLLDLAARERPLRLTEVTRNTVTSPSDPVLLDNLEVLFTPALRSNPLSLLQHLSRDRTIVASWPGTISEGYLRYATPGHPEYRSYPARDLVAVNLEREDAQDTA